MDKELPKFQPVAKLIASPEKEHLNKHLCLICQKKSNKKLVASNKITTKKLQEIIDRCKEHTRYVTEKYTVLNRLLRNKTGVELKDLDISYHYACNKKFTRDEIFIRRVQEHERIEQKAEPFKTDRLLRSSIDTSFSKTKCLFCQCGETDANLYSVAQSSTDQKLLQAFAENPTSLAVYKIRYDSAFDSVAGDIKYHPACWVTHIDRRLPEFTCVSSLESSLSSSIRSPVSTIVSPSSDRDLHSPASIANTTSSTPQSFGEKTVYTDVDIAPQCKRARREIYNEFDTDLVSDLFSSSTVTLSSRDKSYDTEDVALTPEVDEKSRQLILSNIIRGALEELQKGRILCLKDVVDAYREGVKKRGVIDTRDYKALRKFVKRSLKNISFLKFGDSKGNKSQRIFTEDMNSLILHLAEIKKNEDSKDSKVAIVRKAASILRNETLEYMANHKMNFDGSVLTDSPECPNLLSQFFAWTLTGNHELSPLVKTNVEKLSEVASYNLMYNIKTKRQATYKPKGENYTPLHRSCQTTKQQIGLGLALRSSDRNDTILGLLSAKNYGLSITPTQARKYESKIAGAVARDMQENGGIYIPSTLQKGIIPFCHIDNIDFEEDRPDGRGTSHLMQLSFFQRKIEFEVEQPLFKLNLETIDNATDFTDFNRLLHCERPEKTLFRRTPGCADFKRERIVHKSNSTINFYLTLKSLEFTFQEGHNAIWKSLLGTQNANVISEDIGELTPSKQDMNTNKDAQRNTEFEDWVPMFKEMKIPSYSATCAIIRTDIDITLTNIMATPLIPGPVTDWSAVFTSLIRAAGATEWAIGEGAKTVVTLDLDLYERVYLLVNTKEEIRSKFVVCLGEMHAVFAHLRAIGTYISCSGMDDAWMEAHWYDSDCIVRQVLECSHMKRALDAHEANLITINIILLCLIIEENREEFARKGNDVFTVICMARHAIDENDFEGFQKAFAILQTEADSLELEPKILKLKERRKNNMMFQFLMNYRAMVIRLFTFIEATRSRDWLLHLSAADDMMKDFISMDRMKYRRMWAAYIADMQKLEIDEPEVWEAFMKGDISVQKSNVFFTALGRDHAGEQVNRVLKTRGGLKGVSWNENRRNKHLLAAPVLDAIASEMNSNGGISEKRSRKHHQLSKPFTQRQNKKVFSLLEIYNKHGVNISTDEDTPIVNIVTGEVFSDEICRNVVKCEEIGDKLYNEFVVDRLQEESTTSLFAPIQKTNIKTFKSANKRKVIRVRDKEIVLKENANLFAKISIIQKVRNIDVEEIVGNHELTVSVPSLMDVRGNCIPGDEGKSQLVKSVLQITNVQKVRIPRNPDCFVVDAMYLLNQITPKPSWIKTGNDLAKEFCKRIDNRSNEVKCVIVAFDAYPDISLKDGTRKKRQEKKKLKKMPRYYDIQADTNISRISMTELLAHKKTKAALSLLLFESVVEHLKSRNIQFVVAYKSRAVYRFYNETRSVEINHVEADHLLIYCLTIAPLEYLITLIYSVDTDVFVLLGKHHGVINCGRLLMHTSSGECIDISAVHAVLGDHMLDALLSLHCLTGCDTVGKFSGKSKELWTKELLKLHDKDIIQALIQLQVEIDEYVITHLVRFVCMVYLSNRPSMIQKITTLAKCRYYLFIKNRSNCHLLPPTLGAFEKHLKRTQPQIRIWANANEPLVPALEPTEYGWELDGDGYMPITTDDPIAPNSIIELVSCNCSKGCNTQRCSCRSCNEPCTDYCGCNHRDISCENTDMKLEIVHSEEEDEDDEDDDM